MIAMQHLDPKPVVIVKLDRRLTDSPIRVAVPREAAD
jgi:hypothetical protein